MSERRYEVSTHIGPCSEKEAEALVERILDLQEFQAVGGGAVGMQELADDDPLFADPVSA